MFTLEKTGLPKMAAIMDCPS